MAKTTNPSSKKTKLNKRVVLLIGGFVTFAVLVLGGIAYFTITGGPERNQRAGDAAMEAASAAEKAGDENGAYKLYQEALGRYGRAVSKKPNNLSYNQKMLDVLERMTPKTSGDAQELYSRREALLMQRTRSAPLDSAQWMLAIKAAQERAVVFDQPQSWKDLVTICADALDRVPPTDPMTSAIQSIQASARLNQDTILSAEDRSKAEDLAKEFLKTHPSDGEVWAALLQSIEKDGSRKRIAGSVGGAKIRDNDFANVLAQAKAAVPGSASVLMTELQHALVLKNARDPSVTQEAVDAIISPLLWENGDRNSKEVGALAKGDPNLLLDMARLAVYAGSPEYAKKTADLLNTYIAAHPDALLHLGSLAQLQRESNMLEESRVTLEKMLAVPRLKVSMLSAYQDDVRVGAAERIFDLDFSQFESASEQAERVAAIERMKKDRDQIEKVVEGREGELSLVRADAKLAFAANDFLTAVTKLEQVFAKQSQPTPELYLLAAISLIERGELGAALVKIDRGLDEYPGVSQFLVTRARILVQLGRLSDAKRTVAALLDRQPENQEAIRMMAELQKSPGDGTLNLGDMVVKILGDAELIANEGQVEAGIDMLQEALLKYPKDLRLQRTICQWMLFIGDVKGAKELLPVYLAASPDDAILKQLTILAEKESPVDRVTAFVDLQPRTPEDRAVELFIALSNLRDNLEPRLKQVDGERMATLEAEIQKAKTALDAAKAQAIQLAPGNAVLLDRLYTDAVKEKNVATGDQVLALAEKFAKDPTVVPLLRGRIALDRSDFKKAVECFEQAQAMPGSSSAVYRLLGIARERSGDVAGARDAYRTAYEKRPNDLAAVQLYASLLARSGNMEGAREVLRTAMLAMPESVPLRNAYLELEGQFGSRGDSMVERRRMYAIRASDIENARQLMRMLIESPPAPELIFNEDGSTKYPPKEWEAMGEPRRIQELEALEKMHQAEAALVFERLMKINARDRLSLRMFAASMQRAGRGREAEVVVRNYAQAGTGADAWTGWFDLGELLGNDGRSEEVAACFDKAMELDASATCDAARSVAAYWTDKHRPALALKATEVAFAKAPTAELARQLAALHMGLRDFESAKKFVAQAAQLSGDNAAFGDQLLAADIANAELESTVGASDPAEAKKALEEFNEAIDRAIRADPSSPVPFVVRASSAQRRFQRTADEALLEQAKKDADRAYELQGSFWPATRLRASLLADEGNMPAAIQAVRQYVAQNPRVTEARRALIGYQIASGDSAGALVSVNEILKSEPNNPQWVDALAEAYSQAGKLDEAGKAYEKLYQITQSTEILNKAVVMRLSASPPDFAGILATLGKSTTATSESPFLQMAGAAAIAGSADTAVQKNSGLEALRQLLQAAIAGDGSLVDAWFVCAGSLYSANQSAELTKFVMSACGDKPTSAICRVLAQRWIAAGPAGESEARSFATKAVELAANPDEKFAALLTLGGVEYRARQFAAAAKVFEQAVAIRPNDLNAINNLAFVEAMDPAKVAHAIECARKGLAIDAANEDLMDTLGFALTKSGQLPEAVSVLARAARVRPGAAVFTHLAAAQAAAGRKTEALANLQKAKALRPDPDVQIEIGEVESALAKQGR